MFRIKIFLISSAVVLLIIAATVVFSFFHIKNLIYADYGEAGQTKEFIVKNGEGAKNISRRLEDDGLISSDFAFQIYMWQQNAGGKIKAGDYEIPTGINMPAILEMLIDGQTKSNYFWATIPEGFSAQQAVKRIESKGERINGNLETMVSSVPQNFRKDYWFLQEDENGNPETLEGYLFPDTYKFNADASGEEILRKILDNFKNKINPLRGQIELNSMNLYEILTLASIVEKEVSSVDDMRVVAGLFLHRLEIGMPLQSDATINYITNKKMPSPLYKDLEVDSPYNTYKYRGLPPGPICNPGLSAIKAVLNPEKTDYLYFLTPAGKPTVYSKTFKEHEANKRKWLR